MFDRILVIGSLVLVGSLCAAEGTSGPNSGPTPADDSSSSKNSGPPTAVSKELLKFLDVKINLKVAEMSPQLALAWQLKLAGIPLSIRESKRVGERKLSFELVNITLAEALRTISTTVGCQYRIVKSEIRLAMPDEWSEVDAGKTDFEKLVAVQEDAGAPAIEKKK